MPASRRIDKTASGKSISPVIVYDFALRCALRACMEQTHQRSDLRKDRSDRYSLHLGLGDRLSHWSEKFSDDTKPDKLTREIVQSLLRRLDDIKKGRDVSQPEYHDPRFVASVTHLRRSLQLYRYRPSGSINDLVAQFLKIAEGEVKRANTMTPASYDELDRFTKKFVGVLILALSEDTSSTTTTESVEKLRAWMFVQPSGQHSDIRSPVLSKSGNPPVYGSLEAFETNSMVKTVQHLFQVSEVEHNKRVKELHGLCTEPALLLDMKKCIHNVHNGQLFPGRLEDFPNQQVFDQWQQREVKQLTELIKSMMLLNPSLSTNGSDTESLSTGFRASFRNSVYNHDNDSGKSLEGPHTFIPADPRACFRLLMNMCIDYDTNVTPDLERAKTSVFSQQSDNLLRECWKTWRLSGSFRAILYLELVKTRYDENELDFECVKDALRALDKVIKESSIENWANKDREDLNLVMNGLVKTLCHALSEALEEYWKISPGWVDDVASTLNRVYDNSSYGHETTRPRLTLDQLHEIGAAVLRWRSIGQLQEDTENGGLLCLLALADKLTKELVSVTKRHSKIIIQGSFSVPGIVMGRQMPFFALEMENWAYLPEAKSAPIETTFQLYHKVLTLKRLYDQYGTNQKVSLFKVESWFLSHVRRWLKTTYESTPVWVENAIQQDQFVPMNTVLRSSSSIVDLFTVFHEAVNFIHNLQWPNEIQHCRFFTALSKVISMAIDHYTQILEEMIIEEIYSWIEQEPATSVTSAFLNKARLQLTRSRRMKKNNTVPEDFSPELCVKINDIEAARAQLDKLYSVMQVDDISQMMRGNDTPSIEKAEPKNYMYSIKIVSAEDLQPLDHNGLSDPYVIMEINGKQIARTRTAYETLNPRWDQVFDVWLTEKTVDVVAIVYDEDLIGADDECGGVWFKLSPEYYDDYQEHEIELNLHPQGKLKLRVSMEGEKDDIQFWFGRAFRTLRRAEEDSFTLIVDKMSRFIRHCLSKGTLDKVLHRDRSFFRFSRTIKVIDPGLQDCEDAIAPLLDYLERNLKILNDNLSETNLRQAVLNIWKDILITLESVLLPPLSEHLSEVKPLDDYEFHIVFKWLELLKVLFNGGEDEDAVPLEILENSHYYSLLAINAAYNLETEELMEMYNTALSNQAQMRMQGGRKADRSKSVYHSRHTARRERPERKKPSIDIPSSEAILRILRMRPGKHVREFLRTEFDKRNNPAPPSFLATTSLALSSPLPSPSPQLLAPPTST
ncbi:hypothetical protein BDF14DRAFT_1737371 [Spinellus fusiger]|nr:hypothetical protein BDF14DRAFT_1737371 [Spinellus fusiger]